MHALVTLFIKAIATFARLLGPGSMRSVVVEPVLVKQPVRLLLLLWERLTYNAGMRAQFKAVDRESIYLFPPLVEDWLPEKHLASFVVDVVSKLDLHKLKMPSTGVGLEAFNPEMLLALLFYGYATGVSSSRKLEQATYGSIAFRYMSATTQ